MSARPHLMPKHEMDSVELRGEYPRIAPGNYEAYCRGGQIYRDPGYRRWTCLLRFDVLTEGGECIASVPMWLNLGGEAKPRASRRSFYFREWSKASGAPPARRGRLSPKVFARRIARVEVGDTVGPYPYSVVRQILTWETGLIESSSQEVK